MKHIPVQTLQEIKHTLQQMESKLIHQLVETKQESPASDPERVLDNESSDDAIEDIEILKADVIEEHLEERIQQVQAALQRVEQGTYGVTKDGKEIPVARLIIDPTVETLVE